MTRRLLGMGLGVLRVGLLACWFVVWLGSGFVVSVFVSGVSHDLVEGCVSLCLPKPEDPKMMMSSVSFPTFGQF